MFSMVGLQNASERFGLTNISRTPTLALGPLHEGIVGDREEFDPPGEDFPIWERMCRP